METVPIQSLSGNTAPPANASVRGVVTLIWPYSSSTKQCALLLADPDFRLRNRKGQVRVRFTGPSAEAVAKARVGIGDEVDLSLEGAGWAQDGDVTKTPGKSVDGELVFRRRLRMDAATADGQRQICVDAPVSPESSVKFVETAAATPVHKSVKGLRSSLAGSVEGMPIYSSPAFAKRLRLSGESFLDSAYDPFLNGANEYNDVRDEFRSSFGLSRQWRYTERTPSPVKDTYGIPGEDAENESPDPTKLLQQTTQVEQHGKSVEEPQALTAVESSLVMPPPPLPRLQLSHTRLFDEEDISQDHAVTIREPLTPEVRPVSPSTLPLPSPFPIETPVRIFRPPTTPLRPQDPLPGRPASSETGEAVAVETADDDFIPTERLRLQQDAQALYDVKAHVRENLRSEYLEDTEVDEGEEPSSPAERDSSLMDEPTHVTLESDDVEDEELYDVTPPRSPAYVQDLAASAGHTDGTSETAVDAMDKAAEAPDNSHDMIELRGGNSRLQTPQRSSVKGIRKLPPSVFSLDGAAPLREGHNSNRQRQGLTRNVSHFILPGETPAKQPASSASDLGKPLAEVPEPPIALQSEKDRVMARTLSSLFGFRTSPTAQLPDVSILEVPTSDANPPENPTTWIPHARTPVVELTEMAKGRLAAADIGLEDFEPPEDQQSLIEPATEAGPRTPSMLLVETQPALTERSEMTHETPATPDRGVGEQTLPGLENPPIEAAEILQQSYTKDTLSLTSDLDKDPPRDGILPDVLEDIQADIADPSIIEVVALDSHSDEGREEEQPFVPTIEALERDNEQEALFSFLQDVAKHAQDMTSDFQEINEEIVQEDIDEDDDRASLRDVGEQADLEARSDRSEAASSFSPGLETAEDASDASYERISVEMAGEHSIGGNLMDLPTSDSERWEGHFPHEHQRNHSHEEAPQIAGQIQTPTYSPVASDDAPTRQSDGEKITAASFQEGQQESSYHMETSAVGHEAVFDVVDQSTGRREASATPSSYASLTEVVEPAQVDIIQSTGLGVLSSGPAMSDEEPLVEQSQSPLRVDDIDLQPASPIAAYHSAAFSSLPITQGNASGEVHEQKGEEHAITDLEIAPRFNTVGPSTYDQRHSFGQSPPLTQPDDHEETSRSPASMSGNSLRKVVPPTPLHSQLSLIQQNMTKSRLPPTPQLTKMESGPQAEQLLGSRSTRQERINDEQFATPARKSLATRLSIVPDVISAWFSPKRSSNVATTIPQESAKNASSPEEITPKTTAAKHGALANGHSTAERRVSSIKAANGLLTAHAYFTPLSRLDEHLNPSSQQGFGRSTVDVFAVVTDNTKAPERAKGGPKDFFTIFKITDASLATIVSVRVEVFRPWKATLPVAEVGDVVLLRSFAVKSRKHQTYLLSTDASAWCVWRFADAKITADDTDRPVWARRRAISVGSEVREETKGPPVELGERERVHAHGLREWWLSAHSDEKREGMDADGGMIDVDVGPEAAAELGTS